MSENNSVISSVNVTSTDIKCPGCGTSIGINFDPSTANLTCPFCGLSTKLPTPQDGAVAKELDFNTALQRASMDWGRYKKLIVCSNCGGQTIYDSEQVSGACPYCGSTSVAPAAETDQVMVPNAIIPFSISREQAQDLFIEFVKKKMLVNKKVFDCKLEKLVGMYLPFWTFDALTASTYSAFFRENPNDNLRTITGNWYQNIDDILVFASNRIRNPYITRVLDYDVKKAVPYSSEYLAGIPAERYTLGLNDSWEYSKKQITEILKKDVHRTDRRLQVDEIATNYYNVKFRYLLAPIYLAKYSLGKNSYFVAINGQTGKTCCDVPTIIGKIIMFSVIGGLLILGLMFLVMWLLSLL